MEEELTNEEKWQEFRKSGLLWFINSILHVFGWAITVSFSDDKIVEAYPDRVAFRGFSEESNSNGYKKITKFLSENIDELMKEVEEE